jgi:hypothetical protein
MKDRVNKPQFIKQLFNKGVQPMKRLNLMTRSFYLLILLMLNSLPGHAQSTSAMTSVVPMTNFKIPYGDSVIELALTRAAQPLNMLQVRYRPAASCPVVPQVGLQARYLNDNRWYNMPVQNEGKFVPAAGRNLAALKVFFKQTAYREVTCQMEIVGFVGSTTPQPEPRFAGTLTYTGGFVNRAPLQLSGSYVGQTLQLKVPQFCSGVEILEVGTLVGEQLLWAAKDQANPTLFRFNATQQLRSLYVTLNGPKGQNCDIPVYVHGLVAQ